MPSRLHQTFARDLFLATAWLLVLAAINQATTFVVYSIFPYLVPVICLGWRYGVVWGFVAAAAATFAALPSGYASQHPDTLLWAAGSTYLKLTLVVAGVCRGKALGQARSVGR